MRWRGTIQATKVAKTDTSHNQENPRGERLEQEGQREREREIWAEENEKKDWKPGAPHKASRKGTVHQAENTSSQQANLDNRHKGAQPTDRNLDRGS